MECPRLHNIVAEVSKFTINDSQFLSLYVLHMPSCACILSLVRRVTELKVYLRYLTHTCFITPTPAPSHPHLLHHTHTCSITPTPAPSHPHLLHHTHTCSITPTPAPSHPHLLHHTYTCSITPTPAPSHPHLLHHTHTCSIIPTLAPSHPHLLYPTHTWSRCPNLPAPSVLTSLLTLPSLKMSYTSHPFIVKKYINKHTCYTQRCYPSIFHPHIPSTDGSGLKYMQREITNGGFQSR